MLCGDEPYMIEYNCRMGGPETEVVLPRLENDLLEVCRDLYEGKLQLHKPVYSSKACTTVVLASGGYPGNFEKNYPITIPNKIYEDSFVYHAGTRFNENNELLTNGGRVLMVTSLGNTFSDAMEKSMELATEISFDYKYYRKDIGYEFV